MKPPDKVFVLIKSLSKSEKRYFKRFASLHGSGLASYERLFDVMDRMTRYDETAVHEAFKKQRVARQLHVTKNYLYKMILKSLRGFHSGSSRAGQVRNLLRDIEILYKRELFDQARALVGKAEGIARRHDLDAELVEVYGWKRRLLLSHSGARQRREDVEQSIDDAGDAIARIARINAYWKLTIQLINRLPSQAARSTVDTDPLLSNPLLTDPAQADSIQARILYHYIHQTIHFARNEIAEADQAVSDLINFLERNPDHIRENPGAYVTAINNRIGICLHAKNYSAVQDLLKKIRTVSEKYGARQPGPAALRMVFHTYNVELELYRDTGNITEGVALANRIRGYVDETDGIPEDYHLLILYQMAYLYFVNGELDRALGRINEIFRRNFDRTREDIQSFAHLLNLIIHFELGNVIVLRYAVDACRRFLKKKRGLYPYEKVLLRFFARSSVSLPEEHPRLLNRMAKDLFAKDSESIEASVLDYLDFKSWIKKKLHSTEQVPFTAQG